MDAVHDAAEKLRHIQTDNPNSIRKRAVEIVRKAIPCDVVAFFKTVPRDGEMYRTGMTAVGDEDLARYARSLNNERSLTHRFRTKDNGFWDPRMPDPDEVNTFIPMHYDPERILGESDNPVLRSIYGNYHIPEQARTLFYEGRRFIGWFGVMRRRARSFENDGALSDLERLKEPLFSVLTAAERAEQSKIGAPADVIVEPGGPSLEYASKKAKSWLNAERLDLIREVVQNTESRSDGPMPSLVHDGCILRLTRMTGDRRTRYLVTIQHIELPEMAPACELTERQRQVAESAAVGARTDEIARHLGVSATTVRHHLRKVYDRLDVHSRAGLAEKMDVYGQNRAPTI